MPSIRAIINTWPSLPVKLRSRSLCSSPLQISLMEEENDVVQKFHELFRQNKYKEASELAVESIEITRKYLEDLQIERDIAVKQKDQTFKKLEELRKGKTGESSSSSSSVLEFSYPELQAATNDFNKSTNKIREGEFGIVYKGSLRTTPVAIKILNKSRDDKEFDYEVKTLSKVSHPNLVSLIGVHNSHVARAVVYEFLSTDSLQTYLTKGKKPKQTLSWQNRIRIASEICSALIFLHSIKPNAIVHGNLNPENVLLDSNMTCKLSDFGMSRELDQASDNKTECKKTIMPHGTMHYMDPEYQSYKELTTQSDVYSFGIILLQLVTDKIPQNISNNVKRAMKNKQFDREIDGSACKWPKHEAAELASLGLACTSEMRGHRPDLAETVLPKIESLKPAANLH